MKTIWDIIQDAIKAHTTKRVDMDRARPLRQHVLGRLEELGVLLQLEQDLKIEIGEDRVDELATMPLQQLGEWLQNQPRTSN